jgi:hypothetical protein
VGRFGPDQALLASVLRENGIRPREVVDSLVIALLPGWTRP